MQLHYKTTGTGQPIVFLHGLFGNLDNLAILAREFSQNYQVIQIDLRNHGLSPWSDEMNYALMADDVFKLINQLSLQNIILVGHSMGGKVAMQLTQIAPHLIAHMVVLDIAPISYCADSHTRVFKAIDACIVNHLTERKDIQQTMSAYIPEPIILFLLKSYKSGRWLFNYQAITKHYADIRGWSEIEPYRQPVLFIRGSQSNYIIDDYLSEILTQFPYAAITTVEGAGHNVHTAQPKQVVALIKDWLM